MNIDEIIELEIPKLPGWCTPEKSRRMYELARGASLVVELGVFGGRSLCSISLALAEQKFGRADGIDPFEANAALEGTNDVANSEWWSRLNYESIAHAAQMGICALGLYPYARLIRLRSREAVGYYDDGIIDLLHQDSNHSEEVSREEVALWAPKIRHGGCWIADDADWPTTQKAQRDLEEIGFKLIEDQTRWKAYKKQ